MREIYSTHEAARICNVTPMTVIRWIDDGRMPAFRTAGGHRRIYRPDLEAFCRERGIPCDSLHAGRRRALIVCSDEDERAALASAARGIGPEVVVDVARDAFEGGRYVVMARPHVVVLDDRAAGGDIIDVCERMKADGSLGAVELVVFGPTPDSEVARALRKHGGYACLSRPLDGNALRATLRHALGLTTDTVVRRSRVLLVDDDALFRRSMKRELERRGVEVLVAENGVDALLLMGSVKPDLVLLDMQLPDIDGAEIARRLQARPETSDVALAMMSGRGDEKLRRKLQESGVLDFLHKPITVEQVLALIPAREHLIAMD